jgi:hypothetical protein
MTDNNNHNNNSNDVNYNNNSNGSDYIDIIDRPDDLTIPHPGVELHVLTTLCVVRRL